MRIAYASDNIQQREQFQAHLNAYFGIGGLLACLGGSLNGGMTTWCCPYASMPTLLHIACPATCPASLPLYHHASSIG